MEDCGLWALAESGHLNTDLSVSPSLVTFLVSEEIGSSTVLPGVGWGGEERERERD